MEVTFREVDPFNCWIWLGFEEQPTQGERDYIDGVFDSWYVIGRLGGFNAENLQAHEEGTNVSFMNYDNEEAAKGMPALMHNVGQMEYQGNWGRCWVDLGTSDSLALDILINSLQQMDTDIVKLEKIFIGGMNDEWPTEDHPDAIFPRQD